MRLVLIGVLLLLAFGLIGFLLTNLDTRVDVTVWSDVYPQVRLFWVVAIALAVGLAAAGVIGLSEGAVTRLENRRLRKELHKVEAELNYLRTQPPRSTVEPEPGRPAEQTKTADIDTARSGAMLYGSDEGDDTVDPDEDVYSGGRAV